MCPLIQFIECLLDPNGVSTLAKDKGSIIINKRLKYNCHKLGALANPGIRREKEEIIKQLPTLCNFLSSIHTKSR